MKRKAKKIFYTLLFYSYFITLGLAFTFIIVPLVYVLKKIGVNGDGFMFVFVKAFYQGLIRILSFVRVLKVEKFENEEGLHGHGPCIYISNHRSMLDILIYLSKLKDTNCLIKAGPSHRRIIQTEETEVERAGMPGWWGPFIAASLKKLGYIRMPVMKSNMSGLRQTILECRESIDSGRSMIVFPEGTRSVSGRLLPFLTLPFKLAMDSNVPIVPIVIYNTTPIMQKGSIAIDIPHRVSYWIKVLDPIYPARMDAQSLLIKARRGMSQTLREFEKNYGKLEDS